jgi:hypothetical protein
MIKLLLATIVVQGLIPGLTRTLSAQGTWPAFGVYHTAGTIKCVSAKGGVAQAVLPHSWVYTGDKLLLLDNVAELILFDRDSNYIRLHGKGNYTTADIQKMQRTHVRDNITVKYLSLLWEELLRPGSASLIEKEKIARSTGGVSRGLTVILTPRDAYSTSMDSLCFRWHRVNWAKKYFLRLRTPDGDIRFDSVLIDTEVVVHFSPRMPVGYTYIWSLDLVGGSGRLQFSDSSHLILIDESTVLPQVPALEADSLGGPAAILRRIEQLESYGCIREADALYQRLMADFPVDGALNELYFAFRERNYY